MKIVKQSFEILDNLDRNTILRKLELAGRTCYKSEEKITEESASAFIKKLVELKHLAMIEHVSISIKIITNRGISHEIVRHRLCSFAQESSRYCSYNKDKFDNQLTFIDPEYPSNLIALQDVWEKQMMEIESTYLLALPQKPLPYKNGYISLNYVVLKQLIIRFVLL